ncbi:MAG: hypothetical protein ACM3NN_02945 [Nitrospirota bacterium]
MKAKPYRKRGGVRQPLKRAPKRAKGVSSQRVGLTRPSLVEFFSSIDEEEGLAVGESLDEREKRG